MTTLEWVIAAVVVWWMLRRLITDTGRAVANVALAVRGYPPATGAGWRRMTGERPTDTGTDSRYGPGSYLKAVIADRWSDAWQAAHERHEKRREAARAARSRGGGGIDPDTSPGGSQGRSGGRTDRPGWRERLSARWGQARERLSDRWGQAWGRMADRWQARQADREQREHRTGDQPAPDTSQDHGTRSADTDRGDREHTDPRGTGERPAPRVLTARRVGGQWITDTDQSGASTGAGSTNQKGTDHMSEVTGLTSALQHASAMRQAYEAAMANAETYQASLQAGGVDGAAVESVAHAMEAQQQAAAAWAAAEQELGRHVQVREAYEANRGAGSREFVTSE